MTSELRTFIAARREQLQREYDAIQATASPILAELQDLKRAEIALSSKGKSGPRFRTQTGSEPHADSIQGRIIRLLGDRAEGMTSSEIVEGLSDQGGPAARTSVAPQLSRLIGSGHLVRFGGIYSLAAGRKALDTLEQGGGERE